VNPDARLIVLIALEAAAAVAAMFALPMAFRRLELSAAKHRSLAGHARWASRFAAWVPYYEYDEATFFAADFPADETVQRRRRSFAALSERFTALFPKSQAFTQQVESGIPDVQFTSRYRVPPPFSGYVRRHLQAGAFVDCSEGVELRDLDGNRLIDLTGSYGVNTFGYAFYKQCIEHGSAMVRALGPVLGAYHPVVADNVRRLQAISGLDAISFHMSGTEAVMQAVRLARYHTRRRFIVRFCGAYHGWWGDVQPGVGNPVTVKDTFTLAELNQATLRVLRHRNDIACVLVNPLQALHPNRGAPGDSTLIGTRVSEPVDREAYSAWLRQLRDVCTHKGIALIFDEVFVGFRLASGGAQQYFGIQADLVTYGKTLGGGLPVGVLCGQKRWMRRFKHNRPADICFARGTFNAHPYVMGAMHEFLQGLERPEIKALYLGLDETWNTRANDLNKHFAAAGLPIRVANLSSIWTVNYLIPSRYHWMLQFYLRAHGIALSWVGTGRMIFSLNFTQDEFDAVAERILAAAHAMRSDGWWVTDPALTDRSIRRRLLREMIHAKFFRPADSINSPRSK
jgi:glutamate-1-semialdehyde 2,1-aminomutase